MPEDDSIIDTVSDTVSDIATTAKDKVNKAVDKGEEIVEDNAPAVGNFFSKNKMGLLGLAGGLLLGNFIGGGMITTLIMGVLAFAVGSMMGDKEGLASSVMSGRKSGARGVDEPKKAQTVQLVKDGKPIKEREDGMQVIKVKGFDVSDGGHLEVDNASVTVASEHKPVTMYLLGRLSKDGNEFIPTQRISVEDDGKRLLSFKNDTPLPTHGIALEGGGIKANILNGRGFGIDFVTESARLVDDVPDKIKETIARQEAAADVRDANARLRSEHIETRGAEGPITGQGTPEEGAARGK